MSHGDTILSQSDQHYQHVGIARLTQNAAEDYTEAPIKEGGEATNSGVVIQRNEVVGELSLNAFGKGKHGVSVWDVKRFIMELDLSVEVEAAQVNNLEYGIRSGENTRTTAITPDEKGYLAKAKEFAESQTGAAGELLHLYQDITVEKNMPQDMIDGNTFGYLMTQTEYRIFIDSNGLAAAHQIKLGMFARRVIIPLTEVFFDRSTIVGLLDAVILEGLL